MRQPIRERQHALGAPLVFGLFTLAGVIFIITAKLFQQNPFVVTFTPVMLMIAYAIMILALRPLRLRDDQTGDNFYYMGFIFTLTSLGVSLYQFGSNASVDEIVRNFGIAVASTIAGIALRVIFTQLRRDPIEVENVARQELADASRRVRRELDGIVLEMAHFRRTNQQMLEEGFEEVRKQVEISTQRTLGSMGAVSDVTLGQLRLSGEAIDSGPIRQQLSDTVKTVAEVNTSLTKAAEQISLAAAALSQKMDAVKPAEQAIGLDTQQELARAADKISTAVDQLALALAASQLGARPSLLQRLQDRWQKLLPPKPEAGQPPPLTPAKGGAD
jgi:hypothetical protein